MLKIMGLNPPNILSRSLSAPWMLGVYTGADGRSSTFSIATTDFFQNSFAGMLQWEPTMADDLKQLLYPAQVSGIANIPTNQSPIVQASGVGTTSPTTTAPEVKPYFTLRGAFRDRIIQNRDVREFVTVDGDILFLYSFVDNSHLVVAGSEAALSEIVTRLEKQTFLR